MSTESMSEIVSRNSPIFREVLPLEPRTHCLLGPAYCYFFPTLRIATKALKTETLEFIEAKPGKCMCKLGDQLCGGKDFYLHF